MFGLLGRRVEACSLAISRLAVVCPNFIEAIKSEQVVPVVGDQLGLDQLGQQGPGVRVSGTPGGGCAEAVELEAADVADPGGELQPGEVEDREGGQGLPGGVGGVFLMGRSVALPKISSRTATASRQVLGITFVPYVECWSETWVYVVVPSSRKYRDNARAVRLRPRCGKR